MKIKICTQRCIYHHADALCLLLRTMGHEVSVVHEVDRTDETLYIIYVAFEAETPPHYIVYQTEIYGTHWWTGHYQSQCRGALQIWDYAAENMSHYDFGNPKFHIPPFEFEVGELPKKDIELMFYGGVNHRRRQLLDAVKLRSRVPVTIVEHTFGDAMLDFLRRARVVLNIHALDYGPQEIFRITEALSCGCKVITEGRGGYTASGRVRYIDNFRNWHDIMLSRWPQGPVAERFAPDVERIRQALTMAETALSCPKASQEL